MRVIFSNAAAIRSKILSLLLLSFPLSNLIRAEEKNLTSQNIQSLRKNQTRVYLFDDCKGIRPKLSEKGLEFTFNYTGEIFSNLSGGLSGRTGSVYTGLWEMGAEIDAEKLFNWQGGKARLSSFYSHGSSLTQKYLGDLNTVSNIDDYDSLSLFELWIEQNFFEDKLSIRVGQMAADEEFLQNEYSSYLINAAFGWPTVITANAKETPAYGMAGLGARIGGRWGEHFDFKVGIYEGLVDTVDAEGRSLNPHNVRWRLDDEEGLFIISEISFKFDDTDEPRGLRGDYRLGYWRHTGRHNDLRFDTAGFSLADDGGITGNPVTGIPKSYSFNHGFYWSFGQMIYREVNGKSSNEGLGFFFRGGLCPEKNRSLVPYAFDFGWAYKGLFSNRSEDWLVMGYTIAFISDELRELENDRETLTGEEVPKSSFEGVWEMSYLLQVNPYFSLQPCLQYIVNPGGFKDREDAVVVGLRLALSF
ncbi:MAG: carbohydrate porin [Methylacidiphilales bacterium]|nr:carbohydrate porin [Candidatus Methylacidiphilales bacterium]